MIATIRGALRSGFVRGVAVFTRDSASTWRDELNDRVVEADVMHDVREVTLASVVCVELGA